MKQIKSKWIMALEELKMSDRIKVCIRIIFKRHTAKEQKQRIEEQRRILYGFADFMKDNAEGL